MRVQQNLCFNMPTYCADGASFHVTNELANIHNFWHIGFEILMVVRMKMAVFYVVAPCSLVEVYQRFRLTCCLHYRPDDRGSKYL
jgi:hypothetical protein